MLGGAGILLGREPGPGRRGLVQDGVHAAADLRAAARAGHHQGGDHRARRGEGRATRSRWCGRPSRPPPRTPTSSTWRRTRSSRPARSRWAARRPATCAMEGPRQNPPIPKDSAMVLSDMKGKLKLEKAGEITLTPGRVQHQRLQADLHGHQVLARRRPCSRARPSRSRTAAVTTAGGTTSGTTRHHRRHHRPAPPPGLAPPAARPRAARPAARPRVAPTAGGTTSGGIHRRLRRRRRSDRLRGQGGVQVRTPARRPIGDKNATSPVTDQRQEERRELTTSR